jgi:transglutaminase-like putative cysteine protease
VSDATPSPACLEPGDYIDSDHPAVIAFAHRIAGNATDPATVAVRLYDAVRDEITYDPYRAYDDTETYRASAVLAKRRGYCVGKAALLAAAARVRAIPARVAFADVRNHLATPRLLALIGTDLFIYHGITELFLDGHWVKATPTFDRSLCEKFGVRTLDFDGIHDAVLHPFDESGRKHIEYVRQRGSFDDVPVATLMPTMLATYPRLNESSKTQRGDFAREAQESSDKTRL